VATIDVLNTAEAWSAWTKEMRGMSSAELIAQQLVQRGAEHALAELMKAGATPERCEAMLASVRNGLHEIHVAAHERGITLVSYG